MITYTEQDYAVFDALLEQCLDVFENRRTTDVSEIAVDLMSREDVPMHFPFHHFIIPAALLTATAIDRGDDREKLEAMLKLAQERAKNVLGGFCGHYGACGAAVGGGIFMSVYTESSPLSVKTWQWCNEMTAKCLASIAQIEGPRCCKRSSFLALQAAVPYANEKLGTVLTVNEHQLCTFHAMNKQCKKRNCPFYPEEV